MRVQILATIFARPASRPRARAPTARTRPAPAAPAYGNAYQSSSAACLDYGFPAGTTSFNQCVAREQQAARRRPREPRLCRRPVDRAMRARLQLPYGLAAGTASYDRCVQPRGPTPAPIATPQPSRVRPTTRTRTATASMPRVIASTPTAIGWPARRPPYYPSASPRPLSHGPIQQSGRRPGLSRRQRGRPLPARVRTTRRLPRSLSSQAFSRDEFGNRYDAQGNRVDASGRIIATASNTDTR
jgi:hypothetical protein